MRQRILFGALMLSAMAGLLWLDYWLERSGQPAVGVPVAVLLALLMAAGTVELAQLARLGEAPVMTVPAGLAAVALTTAPVWGPVLLPRAAPADLWLLAAPATVMLAFAWQLAVHRLDRPTVRVAATVLTALYLGAGGACILALRVRYGVSVLVLWLAAVKFTDIGAYFAGNFLGRHKLIPWLSPGKSWEGLAGGLAAGVGVGVAIWAALLRPGGTIIEAWQVGLFALVMGLVGQFGDLCESLLKRAASRKDAGALVPQFGGVMDIIDSPLIAGPAGYALWTAMSWTATP